MNISSFAGWDMCTPAQDAAQQKIDIVALVAAGLYLYGIIYLINKTNRKLYKILLGLSIPVLGVVGFILYVLISIDIVGLCT